MAFFCVKSVVFFCLVLHGFGEFCSACRVRALVPVGNTVDTELREVLN